MINLSGVERARRLIHKQDTRKLTGREEGESN